MAEDILKTGKAETKLREIIEAQGGNSKVKPEDVPVGDKTFQVQATQDGEVVWISNEGIAKIAKEAGAPKDNGAGLLLKAKLGDNIKKDQVIIEIFAERNSKLQSAVELAQKIQPVGLSKNPEDRMLMERIPTPVVHKKTFMLER